MVVVPEDDQSRSKYVQLYDYLIIKNIIYLIAILHRS